MSERWSRWQPLHHPCEYAGPAVYKVRLLTSNAVTPISRFLRDDPRGILCIGMTVNMRIRHGAFIRGWQNGRGHSEANLLHQLEDSTELKRILPECVYEYRFRPVRSRAQAASAEEQLIKKYLKRFGEVPPLNSAIPNRYEARR